MKPYHLFIAIESKWRFALYAMFIVGNIVVPVITDQVQIGQTLFTGLFIWAYESLRWYQIQMRVARQGFIEFYKYLVAAIDSYPVSEEAPSGE